MDRKPKTAKTPRQRAQEALGIAERKHTRLTEQVTRNEQQLKDLRRELSDATTYLEYCRQHPALPSTENTPTPQEGPTS